MFRSSGRRSWRRSTRSPTCSGRPIRSRRCTTSTTARSSSSRKAASASSSTAASSSASRGRSSANRSHVQKLEAETKAYLKAGDRATAAKFALELQKAKAELGANEQQLADARDGVRQQPEEDPARQREADRAAREDPEVRRRAEDERGGSGDRQALRELRHEPDDRLRRRSKRSSSRRSIRTAARCASPPTCRTKGIAEIEAEERMQAVLAEEALTNFEVELGLKSPETTPIAQTAKDLGPAADRQGRREADELSSGPSEGRSRADRRSCSMANGQPKPAFYVAVFARRRSASSAWRSGATAAIGPAAAAGRSLERRAEADRRRAPRAPDSSGITTVKEYNYVAGGQAARGQGHLQLQADGRPHRPLRHQRLGRLGPDHLRQQRLQAGQGVEDAGRQGLQGRARADRRPGRDARRLRRRQPPRRLGDARHGAALPRGAAQGLARHAAHLPAGRLVERRRRHRRPRERSRRWPTCAARRSCSRRTRRRTSSC